MWSFSFFFEICFNRETRDGVIFLFMDPLYVVNCIRIDGDQFFCVCGSPVGVAEELAVLFNRYLIYEPIDTEGHDGLTNELDIHLSQQDDPDLVAGCARCRRPIGYGADFLTRAVSSIDLLNVQFLDGVPQDEFFYIEEGLRIMYRCGSYIGYMFELDTWSYRIVGI